MISFIIVNYHVKKELFSCIASIIATKPQTRYEIIVVDNDEKKEIEKDLKKEFPKIIYIKNKNRGYGQGMNTGAKKAKGEYLFILNPDTKMYPDCIDQLVQYLQKNKEVSIVAPLLYDMQNKLVPLQGARTLTPLNAIFSFSFIHKLFPRNPITKKYWFIPEWNKKTMQEVESIPGAAFVIRRKIFEKIHGFDDRFFLFFEEHDLCKRVKEMGFAIVMLPKAKVGHMLGESMKQSKQNINNIFVQSRFYYFKKHFGLLKALLTEFILRTGKYEVMLMLILLVGFLLRLIHIDESMIFIGDQGWFYLSARDMLLTGNIPLVGIASSHPWLHQGALWTYMLAVFFWIFHFNPLSGAYLATMLDCLAIFFLYKLGKSLFSQRTGLIASMLYAVSPLVIMNVRMPYHTSPIPLFTILFLFCLYKWIRGKQYYFPLLIVCLALLYNLEVATFTLSIFTGIIWLYGLLKKQNWARIIFQPKMLLFSVTGFVVAMLPMLLHDVSHGFAQTAKFIAWIGYKILIAAGFFPTHPSHNLSWQTIVNFSSEMYQQLIYPFSGLLTLVIFLGSTCYLFSRLMRREKNLVFLVCLNLFLILGFLVAKTPSQAYLSVMFPGLILATAYFFNWLFDNKYMRDFALPMVVLIALFNCFYMFYLIYATMDDGFTKKVSIAKSIVKDANGKEYTILGRGEGSQFDSFTMDYEYLTWWLGHGPSSKQESVQFVITQDKKEVEVTKVLIKE